MASTEMLLGEVDRLKTHAKTLRERAKEKAEEAGEAVAVILGGAGAGLMEAKVTARPLGLHPNVLAGVGLGVVGLMGWAGRHSSLVTGLGTGVLAYEAGKAVYVKMSQQAPAATAGLVGAGANLYGLPAGRPVTFSDVQAQAARAGRR